MNALPSQDAAPDLLAQLRDIHAPAAPGWWPPAPGWWLLAGATLLVLVLLGRWLWRRHQQRAPLRAALATLDAAAAEQHQNPQQFAHACSAVMKRFLRSHQPRHPALGLSDQAWLDWLAEGNPQFQNPAARWLAADRFRRPNPEATADTDSDRAALQQMTAKWLRQQQPQQPGAVAHV